MAKGIWYVTEAREGDYFWVVDVFRVDENDSTKRVKIGEAPGMTLAEAYRLVGLIVDAD